MIVALCGISILNLSIIVALCRMIEATLCLSITHQNAKSLFVFFQPCISSPDVDTDSRKQKPNGILFYNKNKISVDCFDQMTRLYTTQSASRCWPLSVKGNILDFAAINAKILFVECTGNRNSRQQFVFELMKNIRNEPESTSTGKATSAVAVSATYPDRKRKKCHGKICNNATTCLCLSCTKPTCGTCSVSGSKITFVKC